MNLLSVNGLSKTYGTKTLFRKINFGISHGDKVALVATNGSGKTTLFRILKGQEIADEGEVVFRKDIRVAFLSQDITLENDKTIRELLDAADNKWVACIREYEAALALSEKDPSPANLSRYDDALHAMTELNAWEYEQDMHVVLSSLGISDTSQKAGELSGGQKKRVALALTLINKPDLVVMDEPTNHLDIAMIEWLEHYLQSASLSLLLVTHDRYFLDAVCDRIIELDNGTITEFDGDFEYYVTKKAELDAVRSAEIDKARNLYRRELEWVRKMPKARGTKAKSRLNAFTDLELKAKQKKEQKRIELSVKMERLGSKIIEMHHVSKAYGKRALIKDFTYTFIPGEKIGVVGNNGVGKSTLLKIILGEVQPDGGRVQKGDTVVFGHYSQEGIQLKEDKRILEVVKDIAEFIPLANGASLSASQLLTRFNFPPSVQYSYVSTLSGGEKRRLYLLTVLVKNPNFLILDEPTNDLDIITLQTLEEFLDEFMGCVLIVSHDRYFMDRLVDHVFAFEGEGVIKDFPGNYSEYREWAADRDRGVNSRQATAENIAAAEKFVAEKIAAAPSKEKQVTAKRSYAVQRELDQLEKDIPVLEERKKHLESELASGLTDYQRIAELTDALKSLSEELDAMSMRWLEIMEAD